MPLIPTGTSVLIPFSGVTYWGETASPVVIEPKDRYFGVLAYVFNHPDIRYDVPHSFSVKLPDFTNDTEPED